MLRGEPRHVRGGAYAGAIDRDDDVAGAQVARAGPAGNVVDDRSVAIEVDVETDRSGRGRGRG